LRLAASPAVASLALVSSEHSTASSTPGQLWFKTPVVWITAPLLVLIAAYCWRLWPEWSRNPDLSHGFATPLICVMLIAESRRHGTPRRLPGGGAWSILPTLTIGLSVVLFALAGLVAASLGWDNVLVEFLLSATLATALLSGLLCLSHPRIAALPLNWISLTAAGIWILSAPLPSGTYARITLELQSGVTNGVVAVLQLIGIPARQHGNIIELTRTTVGVEEACSGIRSLLSCTYASFFFAAWQVRSLFGRALLISLAPLLALGMNLLRSLTLTLMANAGMDISGFWHDATGFSILGLTAIILAVLATKLSPRTANTSAAEVATGLRACGSEETGRHGGLPLQVTTPNWGTRMFGLGIGTLAVLAAIFAFYGRPVPPPTTPALDPASLLPDTAAGWQVTTAKDIGKFSGILRTTQLVERTYAKMIAGQPMFFSVYLAHWAPGQAPVSLVASHTPDACWPGAGWLPQTNPTPKTILTLSGHPLPQAEYRIFQSAQSPPREVWFWHVYDGRVINYRDPYSVPALVELALRYGFRREGEQYFIRITSNQPWEKLAQEPLLTEIIAHLTSVGLTP
jgi:exosortase